MNWGIKLYSCIALAALAACAGTLDNQQAYIDALYGASADGGSGNSDSGSSPAPAPATDGGGSGGGGCPDIPSGVFAVKCALSGCHDATNQASGLDLASPNAATRLKGQASSTSGKFVIDTTTPQNSTLYTKLLDPPPFGSRMPEGSSLDSATTQCVLTWIQQAAN